MELVEETVANPISYERSRLKSPVLRLKGCKLGEKSV